MTDPEPKFIPAAASVAADKRATHPAVTPALPGELGPGEPGPKESGGPDGLKPTRYGDWERQGRCIDF